MSSPSRSRSRHALTWRAVATGDWLELALDGLADKARKWDNLQFEGNMKRALYLWMVPWMVPVVLLPGNALVWLAGLLSFGGGAAVAAILVGQQRERRDEQLRRLNPVLDDIRRLKWTELENFVAALYRSRGEKVDPFEADPDRDAAPDGGIDLVSRRGDATIYIQVKQYRDERIPASDVRQLLGAAARDQVRRCRFVTTGEFTSTALKEFGSRRNVELVDGKRLVEMLAELKHRIDLGQLSHPDLQKVAQSLMPTRKADVLPLHRCRKCESLMVLRWSTSQGQMIWVCPQYRSGCGGSILDLNDFERNLLQFQRNPEHTPTLRRPVRVIPSSAAPSRH